MDIIGTSIPDVKILCPKKYGDHRGYFMETFRDSWFRENIADVDFVQDNQSLSTKGILRGLHYQIKQAQGKLVRVISGEVYDVAVDLRKSSPSFGQYVGQVISAENGYQFWVPPGFAHGFYVISDSAEFVYKCTDYYAPEHERSLLWNDTELNIKWPLIDGHAPLLSEKDQNATLFKQSEVYQ